MPTLSRAAFASSVFQFFTVLSVVLVAFPVVGMAATLIVRNGESIQDAVNAAQPGDRIIVKPGIYTAPPGATEYVVKVDKDDITILGSPFAVIDATGVFYGIMVGEDAPIVPEGCPPITVQGFELKGLTIQNAEDTAVRLVGVDGFKLRGSVYLDNEEYGPFPICSSNGIISHNFASGHNDAAIYVGDDDHIIVSHNVAVDSVLGVEIENSTNCEVTHNVIAGNTGGLLIIVVPNLPMPFTENVLVAHNLVSNNNRENTGSGSIAGTPVGTGILVLGSDKVTIEHNKITGNDSFGLGVIANPLAPLDSRIEPFSDELRVEKNKITGNGANPDMGTSLPLPGSDIVFIPDLVDLTSGMVILTDPDPSDNCFEKNRFDVDFPPGIVDLFPCP